MTVKSFLSAVNDWEHVSVEDEEYREFGEGEAQTLRTARGVAGLNVVCAYIGNRSNRACLVVIAEKRGGARE